MQQKFSTFMAAASGILLGLASMASQAVTVNSAQFSVNINLTASCTVTAPTNVSFAYTSGVGLLGTVTNSTFNVTCTSSLPYGVSILTPAFGTVTWPVTDSVVGLQYTLSVVPPATSPYTGTGGVQGYQVTATVGAAQVGTCAAPVAGVCSNALSNNNTYVVQVSY